MDMRRSRPESSSGEGHQHASEAGPSTERSTNVATISPPPEGSSSSTVSHQPSSLPSSVPSQTHIQLQQASDPPSPLPTPPQTDQTNTNISNLTAPRPSTIIAIMHGSASAAVRPPIPLEPPTNTTFSELNSNGEETLQRFQQGPYWDPQASLQDLSARLENIRAQRVGSMDALDRARSNTTSHERMMIIAVDRDRMIPGLPSGSRTSVDEAYERMMERAGGSFTAVRTRTRGPEIMFLPPRSPQGTGGGLADDDDGVTLRGRRVMAHQALASSSRQTEPQQIQATGERLQVVLAGIGGSLASLHGRQLPPPFVTTDREAPPFVQHLPRDLPSPSVTLPHVIPHPLNFIRISSPRRGSPPPADPTSPRPPHPPVQPPTIIERTPSPAQAIPFPSVIRISSPRPRGPYLADSTSPRPPHPPVQPSTIIERTPSPAIPLPYPPSLTHIRYVFDPTGANAPTLAISERSNPAPVVLSRDASPVPLRGEYRQPLLDQPHPLRRRLDDSGRSVGVARHSPAPPSPVGYYPQSPQQYNHDPTNPLEPPMRPRPRSPTPLSDVDYSTLRGWEVVYPSFYPSSPGPAQEAAAFVPPGITDSALPTPRPFNPRPPRRAWRPEDPNGDETITDDEDPATEELQMELRRRSRLMSRSTTNVNDPYEALALIARMDSENQGSLRPGDESNDQEKHGIDDSGDTIMSGIRNGSVGSSRPGSRGSHRSFDLNFTGAGEGEVPIWPCPLPIPPSEMVSKPERVARQWKTRFTPIPPLHGSVARARAAAQAKGSRRVPRRYADPVGR